MRCRTCRYPDATRFLVLARQSPSCALDATPKPDRGRWETKAVIGACGWAGSRIGDAARSGHCQALAPCPASSSTACANPIPVPIPRCPRPELPQRVGRARFVSWVRGGRRREVDEAAKEQIFHLLHDAPLLSHRSIILSAARGLKPLSSGQCCRIILRFLLRASTRQGNKHPMPVEGPTQQKTWPLWRNSQQPGRAVPLQCPAESMMSMAALPPWDQRTPGPLGRPWKSHRGCVLVFILCSHGRFELVAVAS